MPKYQVTLEFEKANAIVVAKDEDEALEKALNIQNHKAIARAGVLMEIDNWVVTLVEDENG